MTDVVGTVADLISSTGTKFYLCATAPTITGVEEDDLDAFDALVWVEVGMVESIGEFGPEGTIGTFMPLGTGVACKYRGTTDNGEVQLSIAKTTTDTGLAALIGRQGNPVEAAFKVELAEAGTGTGALAQRYVFLGLVKSARVTVGSGDELVKVSCTIAITGALIEGDKADGT
jgi:hypothetical protein